MILTKKKIKRRIQLILPKNLWNIIENYNEYSFEKTLRDYTGSIIKDHIGSITCICVTPNGKQIISGGGSDKIVRICHFNSGIYELPIKTLTGHIDFVGSVCVTPNGKQIISVSDDKTIKIWDSKTWKCEKTLRGHINWVRAVCVTPNGKQIISGSDDKTIKIWNLGTSKFDLDLPVKTLEGHYDLVRSVCVTLNGKRIISGSWDKTIRIWNLETGKCEKTLRGHIGSINSVCVTPNKRSDFDREGNKRSDFDREGNKRSDFDRVGNKRSDFDRVGNSEKIISGSDDGTVKIWDLETGKCERTLRGYISSVCVTPNLKEIISGSLDGTIKIWDLELRAKLGKSDLPIQTLKKSNHWVSTVCVHPNGKQIILVSFGIIKILTKQIFKN